MVHISLVFSSTPVWSRTDLVHFPLEPCNNNLQLHKTKLLHSMLKMMAIMDKHDPLFAKKHKQKLCREEYIIDIYFSDEGIKILFLSGNRIGIKSDLVGLSTTFASSLIDTKIVWSVFDISSLFNLTFYVSQFNKYNINSIWSKGNAKIHFHSIWLRFSLLFSFFYVVRE